MALPLCEAMIVVVVAAIEGRRPWHCRGVGRSGSIRVV